jgi:DNA-binding transcriptional LysR family regulator
MPLNTGHLAIFWAVAETRSVSRAAERLMVSQPAVSKQLALLERTLKVRLVDRLPRGVRLTAAGELLAGYARRMVVLLDEGERAMGELAGTRRGRLVVAATPTLGVYWLPPILVRYRRAHPGIEVRMEIHPSQTVARFVADGTVDVGLVEAEVSREDVDSAELMSDRLVVICAPRRPLARKRRPSAADVCREPFVVREVGSGGRSLVEAELARRGLAVDVAMSLGSTEAIKRAVIEGVGVAIVSRLAVETEVTAKRLTIVNVRDLKVERPVYHLTPHHRTPSAAVIAFDRIVQEQLAAHATNHS